MSPRRTSIRDVARESGVSLTTVSLVLNKNDHRISEGTRQRVLDAMQKLDYTPSRLARGLPNRRANTLAVLVPALSHALADVYFGEVISGIYDAAADAGFRILLEVARPQYITRREYMALLDDCSVDGILFIGATEEHQWLSEFHGTDRPMMIVNNHFDQWRLHHVECDYPIAGRLAADHLATLGHRRIGHICGPSRVVRTSRELTDSFIQHLGARGIRLPDSMIVEGEYQVDEAKAACDVLLSRDPTLTAIFCSNDKMAIGAYQSLRAKGLRPGTDVSVMGCDDIPQAALMDPPLTTVRLDFFRVGAEACKRLLERIEGDAPSGMISQRLPVSLVERGSCAPPRGG